MKELSTVLTPPGNKGHVSVARCAEAWYVACAARELRNGVLKRTILGTPLALFRGEDGTPGVLLDRCPHRNVPLSMGRVVQKQLQCPYHGWRFDTAGACRMIPGLCGEAEGPARRVPSFPVREQDGFVWVYMTPDVTPKTEPFRRPLVGASGYSHAYRSVTSPGSLHATMENALDVPHTAFVHAGFFRGVSARNEVEVIVRRAPDRVEAEYVGEPRPSGLVGWLLAPGGGIVIHHDRFILPSIAQVEYRIGNKAHILVTAMGTPVHDFETVIHAAISFRFGIPGWLIRPFLEPVARWIFRQDKLILAPQTTTIMRFGGEQYVSTDADVLGGHIWNLLKQASTGGGIESGELTEVKRHRLEV